jgi:hypothetical protein
MRISNKKEKPITRVIIKSPFVVLSLNSPGVVLPLGWYAYPEEDPFTSSFELQGDVPFQSDLYFALPSGGNPQKLAVRAWSREEIVFTRDLGDVEEYYPPNLPDASSVLVFPPRVASGDTVVATPLAVQVTPKQGSWELMAGGQLIVGKTFSPDSYFQFDHLVFSLPRSLTANSLFRIRYLDPWRLPEFDLPLTVTVAMDDSPPGALRAGPYASDSGFLCVSGTHYSPPDFKLNGTNGLAMVANSSQVTILGMPSNLVPSRQYFLAGSPSSMKLPFQGVGLSSRRADHSALDHVISLKVVGTEFKTSIAVVIADPWTVRLRNAAPLETEGGTSNTLSLVFEASNMPLNATRLFVKPTCFFDEQKSSAPKASDQGEAHDSISLLQGRVSQGVDEAYARFQKRRSLLFGSESPRAYPLDVVIKFIDETQDDAIRQVNFPQLRALRGFIFRQFAAIRSGVAEDGESAGIANATIRLAKNGDSPRKDKVVNKGKSESALTAIVNFFLRLKKASHHLNLRVCVISHPDGANFTYYPESDKDSARTIPTNGSSPGNVWIGSYTYEIFLEGYEPVKIVADFIDETDAFLDCRLKPRWQKAIACSINTKEAHDLCQLKE